MKELKLSEEDQLALVEALENEAPPSKEVFARWMEAVSAYRKWEDAGLEIKEVFEVSDEVH